MVPAAVSDADKAGIFSSTLLYSIEREIDNANHEETLSAQMNSLRHNNRVLNEHISLLMRNFEKAERETFFRKICWQQETCTHTFQLIAGIGIGTSLLIILLYMVIHGNVNRQHRICMKLEESDRKNAGLLAS